MASCILPVAYALTAASISSGICFSTSSFLGLPTSATISSINSTSFLISSCPKKIASSITSSVTSSAPASTIMIASLVPATVRLMSDCSLCSSVGLMMNLPSTLPTLTAAIGPSHGMSDVAIATDAPTIAMISVSQSRSTDITVATTTTSLWYPLGKSGRRGLSISLELRIAFSLGLPSLLINPPGILPEAYIFSS